MEPRQIGWSQESILLWSISKELERLNSLVAGVTGTTNLGYTSGADSGTITSSTGTSAVIPVFSTTVAGLVPPPGTVTGKVLSDSGAWMTVGGGGTPSLTTVGTSGPATLVGSVLNIPQYVGVANLGYTTSATNGTITSSTGTAAVIPLVTNTLAGLLGPVDYVSFQNRTLWMGDWVQQQYLTNQQVLDTGYLAIANKTTTDRPAPQPIGQPGYIYTAPTIPTTSVSAKQVIFGNRYNFQKDVILEAWRVNVVAGNSYSIYLVQNPLVTPVVSQIINYTAQRSGWIPLNVPKTIIKKGSTYDLVATVSQPATTPVTFTANYSYKKPTNSTVPNAGDITQAQNLTTTLRISKTDNNAIDRTAQLGSLLIGDKITGDNTIWAIQSKTDDGTYFSFVVSPATQLASTGVKTFIFETVATTPITYPVAANYWGTNPPVDITVQGLLAINATYFSITPNTTAYGTDILIQEIVPSPDWDIQAFSITGNSIDTSVALETQFTLFSQIDYNLPATATLQKSFNTAVDGVLLDVGVYRVNWLFGVRNLNNSNTQVSLGFLGTAAVTTNTIKFSCNSKKSNNLDIPAVESGQSFQKGQLNTIYNITENNIRSKAAFSLDGIIRILTPGTLIPAVTSNAFNTGTAVIEDRQLFQITKLEI